jgi:hypothetical protein
LDSQNKSSNQGGGGGNRRRRGRGQGPRGGQRTPEGQERSPSGPRPIGGGSRGGARTSSSGTRPSSRSGGNRNRGRNSKVLTTNQILVKYDNLLEQHLITRKKYYEYFNRVDERQLYKLEKNFFDSIEHLRRFEAALEPWQKEALEARKTERYKLDLTYSNNRGWNPEEIAKADFMPDENEDPHFKDSQREAFEEYKEDTEESEGTYEDYLRLKGLN